MEIVSGLNKKLRNVQSESDNEGYKIYIDKLLALEENNYKITINIFMKKLKHFELLKNDADEEEFEKNEIEINELKIKQKDIRESINDIITSLKYDN
jgi:hypothetical protein